MIRQSAKFAARIFAVASVVLILSACGEDRTGTIPSAQDPHSGSGGNIPDPNNPGSIIAKYFPDAAQILLTDTVNYQGVQDIKSPDVFYPTDEGGPLGNPLIQMVIKKNTSSTTAEKVYLAVEDAVEAWAAEIPTVPGATLRTSNSLDMIFSDDYITVRVVGSISGSTLSANIFYRLRVSGEQQCLVRGSLDIVTPCREAYMTTSSSSVKRLGTFSKASYTNWLK